MDGTSFATPLVSGSIVLLQQIYQQRFGTLPTVDQIQSWLQGGSDPIHDPVTGHHDRPARYPQGRRPDPRRGLGDRHAAERSQRTSSQHGLGGDPTRHEHHPTPDDPTPTTSDGTGRSDPDVHSACRVRRRPAPRRRPRATSNQQVLSERGSQSGTTGGTQFWIIAAAVSGLARLLQSMKVWAASSARRG